ncbi:MAG TPA: hypothetical protein VHK47_06525 [Polyangia bacterium]|jgi:hypothetical protein|nr:hypothetical protein [Polyangia bacterium]
MRSKLDPARPSPWNDYYRAADHRRRRAGWHRRSDFKAPKPRFGANVMLAIVMGVALVTVLLSIAIPS